MAMALARKLAAWRKPASVKARRNNLGWRAYCGNNQKPIESGGGRNGGGVMAA